MSNPVDHQKAKLYSRGRIRLDRQRNPRNTMVDTTFGRPELTTKTANYLIWRQSQSCIKMRKNEKIYPQNETHWHQISRHQKSQGQVIDMKYCTTKLMTAYILTNSILKPDYQKHWTNLKLLAHPISEIKEYWKYTSSINLRNRD